MVGTIVTPNLSWSCFVAGAGLEVGTSALERGDDLRASDVVGVLRIVEELCEGDHVRRVETDQAEAEIVRANEEPGDEERDGRNEGFHNGTMKNL
jgi:hypothetical protein